MKGQRNLRLIEIKREAGLPALTDLGTVCLCQSVGEESCLTLQAGRQRGGEPGHRWGISAGGARQSTHRDWASVGALQRYKGHQLPTTLTEVTRFSHQSGCIEGLEVRAAAIETQEQPGHTSAPVRRVRDAGDSDLQASGVNLSLSGGGKVGSATVPPCVPLPRRTHHSPSTPPAS